MFDKKNMIGALLIVLMSRLFMMVTTVYATESKTVTPTQQLQNFPSYKAGGFQNKFVDDDNKNEQATILHQQSNGMWYNSYLFSETDRGADSQYPGSGPSSVNFRTKQSNGSAIFPFGFMGVEKENLNQMGMIADMGVKYIHSWNYQENVDVIWTYLNLAADKKLNVIQQLPGEGNPITKEDYWANYIPALAKHENIAAWYFPDEIGDYDPFMTHAKDLYNWVKKYDPLARPVYGNAGTDNLEVIKRLVSCSDMVWFSAFPGYYGKPRVYVTWAIKEKLAPATKNTPTSYGIIIEFFDPKSWGSSGKISTPEQIRCDVYQSLIAGSQGVWFYSWRWGKKAEGHEPTLNEIAKMAGEIMGSGGLKDVFLSPEKKLAQLSIISGPIQSPAVNNKRYDAIQWTQRKHNGKEYLFAVNVTTQQVTARFSSLPLQSGDAIVLFENRTLRINNSELSDTFSPYEVHLYEMGTIAGVEPIDKMPQQFRLLQNFPNPFNSATTIQFYVPQAAKVALKIFNIRGEEIRTLVDLNETTGWKSVAWDGTDKSGRPVNTGVYIYRLEVYKAIMNRKMMYLR